MATKLTSCRPLLCQATGLTPLVSCRYNSGFGGITLSPATDARLRGIRRRQARNEKFEEERAREQRIIDLQKQQTRSWQAGDVYSPRDLSPAEMKKWRKRQSPSTDIFDALSLNPLHMYKNFAVMSEYVSETGRIKPARETGLRRVNQRKLSKAIRRAVSMGLMPSVHRHPEILMLEKKLQHISIEGSNIDSWTVMSIKIDSTWAACPSTTRGLPTQLSSDSKGERLAYASNKSIFLRSIDTPSISTQYTGHTAETTVARFSPSGYYVASGDASGIVRVWDCVGEGITKGEYPIVSGRINDLAWDGDSQRIIAVGKGNQRFGHCITADSGNTVGEITGHSQVINSVSIRQQRPLRAATAGDDRTLVFYHGAPFKYNTGIRDKHNNYIYGVAFSPDGDSLISVGGDRRIWIYDGKTGEAKGQIGEGEHKGSIFGVSWASDARRFVTASADRTVKLWDVEHGKVIQNWTLGEDGAAGVVDQQVGVVWPSGRSDGLAISLSLSGTLNYLVEGTEKPTRRVEGHQRNITALSSRSSCPSDTFWTGSYDGRVCQWNMSDGGAQKAKGSGHNSYITGFSATSEGNSGRIYSVGWDDKLRSIDLSSNTYTELETKLAAQPKGIATAGDIVLTANSDGIEIFSKGQLSGKFDSKSQITGVAAVGSTVAIGGGDASIRIGKLDSNGTSINVSIETKLSRNPVTALAFSSDASILAAGDSSGRVMVYKVSDGSIVTDRWTAHTSRITSLSWNKESTHLVSGSLDTNIFVWNLARPGDKLQMKNAHQEGVNVVTWIADGSKIASGGVDGCVKAWKVELAE
ncbi:WD40 repeat-like protein [Microsporum audouinii]